MYNWNWEVILQFCTLAVTVYFTSQLVKNDNNREKRHLEEIKATNHDRMMVMLKNVLSKIDVRNESELLKMGKIIADQHGSELLFDAYCLLFYETHQSGRLIRTEEEFAGLMKKIGIIKPKDFYPPPLRKQ